MATDIFIREGLNTRQMAEVAEKYRNEFDIIHVELVDIIGILEFKLQKLYQGSEILTHWIPISGKS